VTYRIAIKTFPGFTLTILLSAIGATAQADPISSSYTITDLGTGTITAMASNGNTLVVNPSENVANLLSTTANGGQFVAVSNGDIAYPFTLTPATPLTPYHGTMTNFPLSVAAPVNDPNTFGNPNNAYSAVTSALMNSNGVVAALDSAGVSGHQGNETAYFVQRNPDGSWGSPVRVWTGAAQFPSGLFAGGATIAGINNQNQIIGTMLASASSQQSNAVLYNITTHSLTNLSDLPILAGYTNITPLTIDDLGRILVQAWPLQFGDSTAQTLLLTPAGVSSDPLEVPAPEPGSFAVMALAIAAFAAHRITAARSASRKGRPFAVR
jgi:hypothetical protein